MSYRRTKHRNTNTRKPLFPFLRKPAGQLTIVVLVIFIIYLIATGAGQTNNNSTREVSVDNSNQMVQSGVFILDVSWQAEWEEYHIPNAMLIPLDQIFNRIGEVPKDRQILIVSRSQTSSQQARDILLSAGLNAVNMAGSMSEWYAKGYPIEGAPPQ